MFIVAPVVATQPTERQRQTVYNGIVFDAQGYQGVFLPENEHVVYVLADTINVLVPKVTDVYWWPLTREYRADWESRDETLDGTVEIGDRSFPMTTYSLRHDGGFDASKASLLVGDEAGQGYRDYEAKRQAYQAEVNAYGDAVKAFNDQLVVWGQEIDRLQKAGLPINNLPVPKQPQAPAQVSVSVTEPEPGVAFNLPAGSYAMRLRGADGQVVPGSERTIVAFGPRRSGVAYTVMAASKYTLPDTSTNPDDLILVRGDTDLYIQPSAEREYDAYASAKMLNPQQHSVQDRRGRWAWLPSGRVTAAEIDLRVGTGATVVSQGTYYAKQRPGSALGFEIVPYGPEAGTGVSTFAAFQVRPVQAEAFVSLPSTAGSTREIRVVRTGSGNLLFALALLPLFGGISWVAFRRWKTR
ncbi:MAG: hypothetical protein H0U52_03580 [Chloroflexi bacterium]|nr:hypothetical protein [Chloroflexota bacterium]